MKVEFYEKLKEELSSIRKEEKIEEINIPTKRSFKSKKVAAVAMLALALAIGLSGVPNTSMTEINPYTVEAKSKKDNKKPVIKFSGKTKITVEKGKAVKIPKTTAKDNKDGNVTKKITVTVKKGKKRYKSIEKAVKKNKKVKFTSTGTYKITYTVKDKAGNKATKTRTIKVVSPKKKTTTETYTTDKSRRVDYSKYDIKRETINGRTYNVTRDGDFSYRSGMADTESDKIFINIKNDYDRLQFDVNSDLLNNSEYLKFFGSITATDQNGNDISDNIVIYEASLIIGGSAKNYDIRSIGIYVEDVYGNKLRKDVELYLRTFEKDTPYGYDDPKDLIQLSKNPLVYGRKRVKENN